MSQHVLPQVVVVAALARCPVMLCSEFNFHQHDQCKCLTGMWQHCNAKCYSVLCVGHKMIIQQQLQMQHADRLM